MLLVIFMSILTFNFKVQGGIVANENKDLAKSAFVKGTEYFSQEKYIEAAKQFWVAYEIKRTWKLLYNIAQSEAAAKKYGLALEAFEKYIAESGDDISKDRRDEVIDEIKALSEMVGDITVTGKSGEIVKIDQVVRGRLPLISSIPVAAGLSHSVSVTSFDGKILYQREIRLRSGQVVNINVNDSKNKKFSSGKLKTAGLIIFFSGSALLAGGTVTGIWALHQQKKLDENCSGELCSGSMQDVEASRNNLALTADILFFTGGVLLTSGIIMLIVNKMRTKKIDKRADIPAIYPVVTKKSGSVFVRVNF